VRGTLDSSAVLGFLLNGDTALRAAESWSWVGASELLFVECHRVLERVRVQRDVTEDQYHDSLSWLREFLDGVILVPIGSAIVRRASRPFPVLLKTLDAIHLATLDHVVGGDASADWAFLTTDLALGKAARLLGYTVP
jgi:hypothetical protein